MPETSPDGFPYPEASADANVPKDIKALADKMQERYAAISLSKLTVPGGEGDDAKIAIVENGVIKLKAMSGDATISEAGLLTIGSEKVDTPELAKESVTAAILDEGAATEAKHADGSVTSRKMKPTIGVKSASAELALGTSYADVAGCLLEVTPAVASILKVTTVFRFGLSVSSGGSCRAQGALKVDAETEIADVAELESSTVSSASGLIATVVQVHAIPLTAAAHKVQMRAKHAVSGGSSGTALKSGTRMLYELVAS